MSEELGNVSAAFVDYSRELGNVRVKRFCFTEVSGRVTFIDVHWFLIVLNIFNLFGCGLLKKQTSIGVTVKFTGGENKGSL